MCALLAHERRLRRFEEKKNLRHSELRTADRWTMRRQAAAIQGQPAGLSIQTSGAKIATVASTGSDPQPRRNASRAPAHDVGAVESARRCREEGHDDPARTRACQVGERDLGRHSLPPLWLTWDLAGRGRWLSLIRPLLGNSGRQGRALG